MPRALLSVSDKTGIVDLGRGLAARGFELVSTGGTARALGDAGLPVTTVSALTGFPEMMDGRVKTLHPALHGGILARRDRSDDLAALASAGIAPIDIVVVNLYPFRQTATRSGVTFDELVEQIDIGGPSLIRAAAKNFRGVLVVVNPAKYESLISTLDRSEGPSLDERFALAIEAFKHTAGYDRVIYDELREFRAENGGFARAGERLSQDRIDLALEQVRTLRYGENPHQQGSLLESAADPLGLTFVQGKELSYTNLLDLDAAWRIVQEFTEPAATVIKHTNPCGAAIGASAADAYVGARDADPLSAFGGIVGLNRELDVETAQAITSTFIEAVITPSVAHEAQPVLARKDKLRVVTIAPSGQGGSSRWCASELRSVFGGFLMQDVDRVTEGHERWPQGEFPRVVTRVRPTPEQWEALRFAWRVCAHVKSNTVIFTSRNLTLAIGAGQTSRVDAAQVAVMKATAAGRGLVGSVAASDAYFPFRDGLDVVAAAGATAVVQPGGSVRDPEVIAAADEHGLAMVFTGRRHFRH